MATTSNLQEPLYTKAFTEFLCSRAAHVCACSSAVNGRCLYQVFAVGFPECPLAVFASLRAAQIWVRMKLGSSSGPISIVIFNAARQLVDETNA